MKFFIDTADLNEIEEANDLGVLDGVTTNPSLCMKVGVVILKVILQKSVILWRAMYPRK